MPTLNDVIVVLVTHDDQKPIVEHDSPPSSASPTSATVTSVHCAFEPFQRFQIHYSCPPQSLLSDTKLFYCKLFADGKHIVSWDCGPAHEWEGKVEFIPGAGHEKYGLMFEELGHEVKVLEMQVFRATARKTGQQRDDQLGGAIDGTGLRLSPVGALHQEQPQTYYTYALLDAVDAPYATFFFQCCSPGTIDRTFVEPSEALTMPDHLRTLGFGSNTSTSQKASTVRSVPYRDGPASDGRKLGNETPSPVQDRRSSAQGQHATDGTPSPSKTRSPRAALLESVVARSLKRTVHASRQIVKGYEKPI